MRHSTVLLLATTIPLGLTLLLISTLPAVAEPAGVTPLPPVAGTDGQGGVSWSFYYASPPNRPFIQMAYDAGSRWDRFDFNWPVIEPSNNNWNFGPHDAVVNDLLAAGVNSIGILQMTPQWAATQCALGQNATPDALQSPGWYPPAPRVSAGDLSSQFLFPEDSWSDWWTKTPPQGLPLLWNDPNNHWGNFVYNVVYHYRDKVKHWEMWNEAEWDLFWCGSDADYARLLKVGYKATKAACPDCTVLFGGLHYWADQTFFERVLDIINDDPEAPAYNYFFDVMSVHFYSRSSDAYNMVNHVRSRMKLYVPDHPIWLTETGVPVWNDSSADPNPTKYDFAATQNEAAAYVIQSYANARAAGVERYIFFRTHDDGMSEYFGLIRNDYSLRPAYVAYQVATTYLISPSFTTRVPSGSHVRVTLWGTPRGKVSVLWNESPTAASYVLSATLDTATLVNRWGSTSTVIATGGVYTLTLPGATANLVSNPSDYIIGGDPLIVIESETANEPPTSTVIPLPALTYSPIFTVAWEGQDNESGVWLYDVQVRDGESSAWSDWRVMTSTTSGQFAGQDGHTYYFRSRSLDRLGNRGPWPDQPQAHTTVDLSSEFHFSVGAFFADENRNGIWDAPIPETGEITLTQVSLRFLDRAGQDVVSPTVGSTWEFTTTVYAGQPYWLLAMSADHMRALSFVWPLAGEVYTETALGLWPISRSYLPLAMRGE